MHTGQSVPNPCWTACIDEAQACMMPVLILSVIQLHCEDYTNVTRIALLG
jgi:hypothetical protein